MYIFKADNAVVQNKLKTLLLFSLRKQKEKPLSKPILTGNKEALIERPSNHSKWKQNQLVKVVTRIW